MPKPIFQKISAGIVIFDKDSKVLIIQRNKDEDTYPGLWEIPGGKKEDLESVENCAIREVKEETDLEIEILGLVNSFSYIIEKTDHIKDVLQLNFIAKDKTNCIVKLSKEHTAYSWISKDGLSNIDMSAETKKTIMRAFELNTQL